MEEGNPEARLTALHDHLRATAERPVERTASRWIGEAEAVAGDLVGEDVEPGVLEDRVGHVIDLLSNVEATGDPEADEHVEAARRIARTLTDD